MRVCHLLPKTDRLNQLVAKVLICKGLMSFFSTLFLLFATCAQVLANTGPNGSTLSLGEIILVENTVLSCDNVVNGGLIQGDEFGCPNPTWDPSPITNVALPFGGTGTLQYLWIFTTGDPNMPISQWTPIPNSNSPDYDPGPISVTTHYRRCARRSGCTEYVGETNIVTKEVLCCDNVTDGGTIGNDQVGCQAPFDPAPLVNLTLPTGGTNVLQYQWIFSIAGTPYFPGSPDWAIIPGAVQAGYDPGPVSQTTYFIRLSRRHGCSDYDGVSNMVTITIAAPMVAGATASHVTCAGGSDGAIATTVSGGSLPYQYAWNPVLGNVQDPQGLSAGSYAVTVTDLNGCTATASATVNDGITLAPQVGAVDETCPGAGDGSAAVTDPGGGTSPYNYQWDVPFTGDVPAIFNLSAGNYSVTVTDADGCAGQADFTVGEGTPLSLEIDWTDETCLGSLNGTATVTAITNGTPGYSYTWSFPFAGDTETVTDLPPNVYTVTVTDALGCTASAGFTIQSGPALEVAVAATPVSCFGGNDGTETVT